jgi:UDP-glucuronate decarboxylase
MYGDGSQTRSFCYIDDLVEGLLRLMTTPDEITGPVNLGNPVEHSIRELADKIINLTGGRSRLVLRPLPENDPRRRRPDISLARKLLDWKPRVSLDEGLARTIAWFERMMREGRA